MMDNTSRKYEDLENELENIQSEQLKILRERAERIKNQLNNQKSLDDIGWDKYNTGKFLLNE